ncbi:MAG: DNA polymerase III subunit epsilon [Holosporales bacterium]|nr:DNA polymerase III subunit epsilon [Holosporales bacterium]
MREVILDTETTGLSVVDGDRIIEIGCVEVIDKKQTGRTFHTYVNPEREVSPRAEEICGLNYQFLKDCRVFKDVHQEFLEFILGDVLVIHNAPFDVGFLNHELSKVCLYTIDNSRIIDTLALAKKKYPGSPATLDALCRKFNVDNTSRVKHGALIDASLLAEVYIEMSVEVVQRGIFDTVNKAPKRTKEDSPKTATITERVFRPTDEELAAHAELLSTIKNPIWSKFIP